MLEEVRKAARQIGKEAATQRAEANPLAVPIQGNFQELAR